jgi:hypothetical protein
MEETKEPTGKYFTFFNYCNIILCGYCECDQRRFIPKLTEGRP